MRANVTSGYPYEESFGYSRAVRVGNQVYVSGTTARGEALGGDAYVQTNAAIALIRDALADAGAELRHVVRTVVYVRDLADLPAIARAHAEAFGDVRPANTLVGETRMVPEEALVEIEATAIVHEE